MDLLNEIINNSVTIGDDTMSKKYILLAFILPLILYVVCSSIYITISMVGQYCPCCYYGDKSDYSCGTHGCCRNKRDQTRCTRQDCISILKFVLIFFGGLFYYTGDNLRSFLENLGVTEATLQDVEYAEPFLLFFALLLYRIGPLFVKKCSEVFIGKSETKSTENIIVTILEMTTMAIELDFLFTIVQPSPETLCPKYAVALQWTLFVVSLFTYGIMIIITLVYQYHTIVRKNKSLLCCEFCCAIALAVLSIIALGLFLLGDNTLPINCAGIFKDNDNKTARFNLVLVLPIIVYLIAFVLSLVFTYYTKAEKNTQLLNSVHDLITMSDQLQRKWGKNGGDLTTEDDDLKSIAAECDKLGEYLWKLAIGKGTEEDYRDHEVPKDQRCNDLQTMSYKLQRFSYDLHSMGSEIKIMESESEDGIGGTFDSELQPIQVNLKAMAISLKGMGQNLRNREAKPQETTPQVRVSQETNSGNQTTGDELKRLRVELQRIGGTPQGPTPQEPLFMHLFLKSRCACNCTRCVPQNVLLSGLLVYW